MHSQNSAPIALQGVLEHWTALAHDADPIVSAAARELLADLKQVSRPRVRPEDRPAAEWRAVIGKVIADESRSSVTDDGYKTGHGFAHTSKSGTCVSVNTRLGKWYCSSCRHGGTAVTWLMDTEQCGYGQAWELLVRRFGAKYANADPD